MHSRVSSSYREVCLRGPSRNMMPSSGAIFEVAVSSMNRTLVFGPSWSTMISATLIGGRTTPSSCPPKWNHEPMSANGTRTVLSPSSSRVAIGLWKYCPPESWNLSTIGCPDLFDSKVIATSDTSPGSGARPGDMPIYPGLPPKSQVSTWSRKALDPVSPRRLVIRDAPRTMKSVRR